jgi:hypothetical protein
MYFDKYKLAIHAFEEGRGIDWTYSIILHFEHKTVCRKYTATLHALCSANPIIQANLETSPLCIKKRYSFCLMVEL